MNLDDYGYFDGGVFVFKEPFPFLHENGVTLMSELDVRRFRRSGFDAETLISCILKQQLGVDDPLRQREPDQETPKQDPGE